MDSHFSKLHQTLGLIVAPRIGEHKPLSKAVTLGATDTLKILLTTKEDNKAKRPHQTFLLVKDPKSNLDTSFAFQIKENGKGKIELVCHPSKHPIFLIINPMYRPRRTFLPNYYPQQDLSMRPWSSDLLAPQSHTTAKPLISPSISMPALRYPHQRSRCAMGNSQRFTTSSNQIPKVLQ